MSIKGLTDRGLSFPEIGRVRKGDKKTDNKPGKDLTYFRVEFDEQEVEASARFKEIYGEHPSEINVILPFDEIERCWDAWLEAYTAGRMVARSDGEKYLYLVDTKTGLVVIKNGQPERPYIDGEVIGSWKNRNTGKEEVIKCKPAGRLKVIIPELARAAYLTVLTGSLHDIGNISAQLAAFKAVNNGRIAGIPLVLRRRPKPISTPKPDGTRARYMKWMLSIEADPQWVKAMLMETKRLALPGNGLALLSPGEVLPKMESPEWTDGEFVEENEGDPLSEVEIEQVEEEQMTSAVSLETAENMTTSKGDRYGDMDNTLLAAVATGITKAMKKPDVAPERMEELQYKLDCALAVLSARAEKIATEAQAETN